MGMIEDNTNAAAAKRLELSTAVHGSRGPTVFLQKNLAGLLLHAMAHHANEHLNDDWAIALHGR
jgi:hypothetical protein